jgi:hypothetical protein
MGCDQRKRLLVRQYLELTPPATLPANNASIRAGTCLCQGVPA